jgi:hypothetical protein
MAGLVQGNMDEGRGMAVIRRISVDECDLSTIKGGAGAWLAWLSQEIAIKTRKKALITELSGNILVLQINRLVIFIKEIGINR